MIERKVEIVSPHGLHTRPAATIVKLAAKYRSEFFLNKDGLAAVKGSYLELEFEGPDEEAMANELIDYFKRGFDEI